MKLTEGQTLVYAYEQWVARDTLTVGKVRRKYADVVENEDLRIDMENMRLERSHNGRWAGWCYTSNAAMLAERDAEMARRSASRLWDGFRQQLPYRMPDGMTSECITNAAEMLGFVATEPPPRR